MRRRLANLRKLANLARGGLRFSLRAPRSAPRLLRLCFWTLAVSLLVRALPLSRALQIISPRPPKIATIKDQTLPPAQLAALLDRLLRIDFWVFTPTCWKRAAVLRRLLALEGIQTRIVFGVRKAGDDALSGHAWLEADGQPFLEPQPPDYTVVYVFPD